MNEDRWFHHPEMQARVVEAEADFREGRFVETKTPEEAQAYLDSQATRGPPSASKAKSKRRV